MISDINNTGLPNGSDYGIKDRGCNLLPSANSSLPLAANWENIPETLLLNGSIGFILYVLFLVMTQIAWTRSNSDEGYINQGLITFLYGYRDPERWYVIPRFEFLRRSDRHHKHDMNNPNIYVPPKLPLANPIELFAYDSVTDESKSLDEPSVGRKTLNILKPGQTRKSIKELKAFPRTKQNNKRGLNDSKSKSGRKLQDSSSLNTTLKSLKAAIPQVPFGNSPISKGHSPKASSKTVENEIAKSSPPLDQSFFYPSILTAEQLQASYLSKKLNQFFSLFFCVTDADIIYAKGIDAYEYLLFQRHLILIMFIANLFCLGIILPIHWFSGENLEETELVYTTSFQRTTIKNMSSNSDHYWAHIISSICIVVMTISTLNSYSESTMSKNETQLARRTLIIGNIPVQQRNRVKLTKILRNYFPRSNIEAIQFVYDSSLLGRYQMQLDAIIAAKEYCLYYKHRYNQEIMVKQTDVNVDQCCNGNCRLCSFFYVCCYYWPRETKQPGTVFYTQQEQYYRDKIQKTCENLVKNPSEYAFVTFKSNKQARRVMEELTRLKTEILSEKYSKMLVRPFSNVSATSGKSLDSGNSEKTVTLKGLMNQNSEFLITSSNAVNDPLDPKNNPHIRSIRSPIAKKIIHNNLNQLDEQRQALGKSKAELTELEGPIGWSIRYAPHPDNVEYSDLLYLATTSKYTIALLHVLMIIIFIFITTPNVLMSILERWTVLQPERAKQLTGYQGAFINYLSVLLQIIASSLLPSLITLISKQIPYEDTASKNHSIMWKVYSFLVLMVIVMPSIGMSSAQALLSSSINPKCLFPTDNGAYFINYVLSSIFLSTMLELIKPVDIISYYFILLTGRSSADFEGGRQYIEREFSVSMQHTAVLLVFSVVMTYAISCPLIAPAGLIYLIIKHAVDHYHLFYTYFTKKVDKNQQHTIEIFVRVALLLMLFQTTVAISINTGTSYFSLISQIVFWISLAVFLFNCFFNCTSRAMMITKPNRHQREFCACFYLPRVIEDLLRSNSIPMSCISREI